MSKWSMLGRPKSFVTTTPAVTINDLLQGSTIRLDHESHRHFGNRRHPRTTIGNDNTRITIVTTDIAAYQNFHKDREVGGLTMEFELPAELISELGVANPEAGSITITVSNARVDEAVELAPNDDGSPGQFTVSFYPSIKQADGTAPTITRTITIGGED